MGNNRIGLNEDTVGVPVIAIGVPMVVDAATIAADSIDIFIEKKLIKNSLEDLLITLQ